MDSKPAPTYSELRLQLAQARLELAQTTMSYNLLHAATSAARTAPLLPGPRWHGSAH